MWSSRRLFCLSLLSVAGCGFTPVYGPNGGAKALQGAIRVDDPDDRDGFAFVGQMEKRLGRPSAPSFALSYDITTTESGLAITGSNDVTRFNIEGSIRYKVTRLGTDEVVTEGTARSFTAYSASGSTISTLASSRDARARLMSILADQIVTRLFAAQEDFAVG